MLLAMVVGTRPAVTPAMVLNHLHTHFGITDERMSMRRSHPDDFIICFTNHDDLELILGTPTP